MYQNAILVTVSLFVYILFGFLSSFNKNLTNEHTFSTLSLHFVITWFVANLIYSSPTLARIMRLTSSLSCPSSLLFNPNYCLLAECLGMLWLPLYSPNSNMSLAHLLTHSFYSLFIYIIICYLSCTSITSNFDLFRPMIQSSSSNLSILSSYRTIYLAPINGHHTLWYHIFQWLKCVNVWNINDRLS